MSTVEERVKKIVCEQLGVKESEVQNTSSFVEDLGADSLDTVELVMALEEEFETEVADEEAEKLATVPNAIDYIVAHTCYSAGQIARRKPSFLFIEGRLFYWLKVGKPGKNSYRPIG